MESPVVQQIRQLYEVEGLSLRYKLEGRWTPWGFEVPLSRAEP